MPDFSNSPGLLYLKESVRLLVDKVKGQVPVCGIVTAPIDLPAEVMGIDTWISTLISQPDMAREVLAVATKHFVNLANAHLADGATFIAVPMVFNSPRFLYKKLIDTIIMPTIVSAFSQVKGPIVFHHAGSPLVPLIKEYTSLPNIVGFVFDHRDSLVEARAALSKGTLILGNLLGPTLASVPTDFIRAKVNAMLDDRTNDQNYIFATSAADVPFDTPPERIVAIADTIRSWERTW